MAEPVKWVNEYSKVQSTVEFRLSSQSEEVDETGKEDTTKIHTKTQIKTQTKTHK